jgi:sugar phosphate isomerase/epimerase
MMRFGFRTAGFRRSSLQEALDAIADAGYDAVEVCLEYHGLVDLEPEEMRQVLDGVASRGLTLSSLSYHGDGEPPAERWANMARSLELAAACEVPILVINGDRPGEDAGANRREDFIRRAVPVAARAQEAGVLLAVEPEPLLSVANTDDMAVVLSELPSPPMAVNLDVGHAFLTDDLRDTFERLGPHIAHLHVEDMRAGVHRHLLPGDGDIDFRLVRSLAEKVGFTGPWVVDLFSADADPFEYCRQALARLREVVGE